jgi:hypothetical protein
MSDSDHLREQHERANRLCALAHARGDFEVGEPLARRAVAIREQAPGTDHPQVLALQVAWGGLLDGLKRFAQSEPIYPRALGVHRALGEVVEIAATLNRRLSSGSPSADAPAIS